MQINFFNGVPLATDGDPNYRPLQAAEGQLTDGQFSLGPHANKRARISSIAEENLPNKRPHFLDNRGLQREVVAGEQFTSPDPFQGSTIVQNFFESPYLISFRRDRPYHSTIAQPLATADSYQTPPQHPSYLLGHIKQKARNSEKNGEKELKLSRKYQFPTQNCALGGQVEEKTNLSLKELADFALLYEGIETDCTAGSPLPQGALYQPSLSTASNSTEITAEQLAVANQLLQTLFKLDTFTGDFVTSAKNQGYPILPANENTHELTCQVTMTENGRSVYQSTVERVNTIILSNLVISKVKYPERIRKSMWLKDNVQGKYSVTSSRLLGNLLSCTIQFRINYSQDWNSGKNQVAYDFQFLDHMIKEGVVFISRHRTNIAQKHLKAAIKLSDNNGRASAISRLICQLEWFKRLKVNLLLLSTPTVRVLPHSQSGENQVWRAIVLSENDRVEEGNSIESQPIPLDEYYGVIPTGESATSGGEERSAF